MFEIRINTNSYVGELCDKEKYENDLAVALLRFGFAPYIDIESGICFVIPEGAVSGISSKDEEDEIEKNIL